MNFVIEPLLPAWALVIVGIAVGMTVYFWLKKDMQFYKRDFKRSEELMKKYEELLQDKDQVIKLQSEKINKLEKGLADAMADLIDKDKIIGQNLQHYITSTKDQYTEATERELGLAKTLDATERELEKCRQAYSQLQHLAWEADIIPGGKALVKDDNHEGTKEDPLEFGEAGM